MFGYTREISTLLSLTVWCGQQHNFHVTLQEESFSVCVWGIHSLFLLWYEVFSYHDEGMNYLVFRCIDTRQQSEEIIVLWHNFTILKYSAISW